MVDRRSILLAAEIRDLYRLHCQYADRINSRNEAATRAFVDKFRPRPSPRTPELERFETVFEQRAALRQAMAAPPIRSRLQLLRAATWVLVVVGCLWLQSQHASLLAILLVVCAGSTGLLWCQHRFWLRRLIQRNLREQLVARGVPICLECGYDLRGQVEPRCPECGTRQERAGSREAGASAAVASSISDATRAPRPGSKQYAEVC